MVRENNPCSAKKTFGRASLHPRFEGRQHALAPHRRFHPRPAGTDLSGLCSRWRHCRRLVLRRCVAHAFHLPARPSLHVRYGRFHATTGALTPAPTLAALRLAVSMNTALDPSRRSPCFTHTVFGAVPSPTTPWRHSLAFARYPSAVSASDNGVAGAGLRLSLADSPHHRAESRSSSYGPAPPSQCFGPHLAVTPFCLVTGRRAHA